MFDSLVETRPKETALIQAVADYGIACREGRTDAFEPVIRMIVGLELDK